MSRDTSFRYILDQFIQRISLFIGVKIDRLRDSRSTITQLCHSLVRSKLIVMTKARTFITVVLFFPAQSYQHDRPDSYQGEEKWVLLKAFIRTVPTVAQITLSSRRRQSNKVPVIQDGFYCLRDRGPTPLEVIALGGKDLHDCYYTWNSEIIILSFPFCLVVQGVKDGSGPPSTQL
ncbi:hypothetical protein Tco_0528854 [Tanacetum coccineum]